MLVVSCVRVGVGAHRVCDGVRHAVRVLPGCLLLFPEHLDGLFPLVAQRRDEGLQQTSGGVLVYHIGASIEQTISQAQLDAPST